MTTPLVNYSSDSSTIPNSFFRMSRADHNPCEMAMTMELESDNAVDESVLQCSAQPDTLSCVLHHTLVNIEYSSRTVLQYFRVLVAWMRSGQSSHLPLCATGRGNCCSTEASGLANENLRCRYSCLSFLGCGKLGGSLCWSDSTLESESVPDPERTLLYGMMERTLTARTIFLRTIALQNLWGKTFSRYSDVA